MLSKRFASTALCALLLLASAPPRAEAQTPRAEPRAAAAERRALSAPDAEAGTRLKELFAESASRIGEGRATEAEFKRLGEMRRQQQQDPQSDPGEKWSKRKKVLMIIAIIGVVALSAWAIANSVENPPSFCDTAPFDPDCIPT